MTKTFYWLKLPVGFFNQREIKGLRKLARGDTYTIIYLKMLLLATPTEGSIYFQGIEDEFASDIALELDEDPENVKATLDYLESKRLIEYVSEDELKVLEVENMTGSETDAARRMRNSRANKKAKANSSGATERNNVTPTSNEVTQGLRSSYTEIEIEKELELEREEEPETDPRPLYPDNNIDSIRNIYSNTTTNLVSSSNIDEEIDAMCTSRKDKLLSQAKEYNRTTGHEEEEG
ncbi:phage replisome organizer N-terminal domain-containing protein [Abiotrophia defectiva]|uniref:phage replisome organizer N-terminal domain-containing protein n=1 Tax=Abiotrophia defectiva TaxID=46125 RepID=UPI0028E97B7C|nr:phage replisome organizer N-terminal domain-containing protein [Abiotrophia defectiva]